MILVENKYGHGAKLKSKLHYKLKRLKRLSLGKASIPFDWSIGVQGRPTYNIKNQYESSSCWGQAFSRAVQILYNSDELSAKSAYSQIYAPGGGVDLYSGEQEALNKGLTTEIKVPSILNGDALESFMEDTSWKTSEALIDCATRAGLQVVNVDINIDSIAQAIRDYRFVIFLFRGQNNGTWLNPIPIPPTSKDNTWGHFVCSDSNVPAWPSALSPQKLIRFYESWGEQVGDKGFQYFSEDYINSGYILDVITFIPFKFNMDLRQGMKNNDVLQLQRRLGVSMQTGYFGPRTLEAVKQYQLKNGLPNTGFVGPLTRQKLNSMI